MRIISKNSHIQFESEGNETAEELEFIKRINEYELRANGASVAAYKDGKLILHINSFDNTVLIFQPEGVTLAKDFGAKRFIVGDARQQMTEAQLVGANAIRFSRDRSFSMDDAKSTMIYRVVDKKGLADCYQADKEKMYQELASLFGQCADFTPGKQEEYLSGGSLEDKYCRFNSGNQHLFLLDQRNTLIGTLSVAEGVYFYDEIVNYFTLLNDAEAQAVKEKASALSNEKDDQKKDALKNEIAAIVEPMREILLKQLFAAARQYFGANIDPSKAFIRVAAGREQAYERIGCGEANTGSYVIHGAPTPQLKMLDAHIKSWAREQLKALQPKPSVTSLFSAQTVPSAEVVADSQNTPAAKF